MTDGRRGEQAGNSADNSAPYPALPVNSNHGAVTSIPAILLRTQPVNRVHRPRTLMAGHNELTTAIGPLVAGGRERHERGGDNPGGQTVFIGLRTGTVIAATPK